ncbi:hypothetical protein [Acidipropionibacterium thoenii]|uniref:hypothetical protein n=1 Tax=Acidipropionibacterium thoenii TaxID=1751 RepID=UPI0003F67A09|nr:hypothetical protein [Acidipropionibacterium thoenii]
MDPRTREELIADLKRRRYEGTIDERTYEGRRSQILLGDNPESRIAPEGRRHAARVGVGIGVLVVFVALGVTALVFLGRYGLLPMALCLAVGGYMAWRQFHPHID